MKTLPELSDFPSQSFDKLRFGDTDKLGHVNNAVFSTLYETGRIAALGRDCVPFDPGCMYVIARITIDFRGEILWPGTVEIGTAITAFGNSSITFRQALYQGGKCVSTAESVAVQIDEATHRPAPLSAAAREFLGGLVVP